MHLIAHVGSPSGAHTPPSLALPLTPDTAALIRETAGQARALGKVLRVLIPGIRATALRVQDCGQHVSSEDGSTPALCAAPAGHAFIGPLPSLPTAFWEDQRNDISVRGVRIGPGGRLHLFAWSEYDIIYMESGGLNALAALNMLPVV